MEAAEIGGAADQLEFLAEGGEGEEQSAPDLPDQEGTLLLSVFSHCTYLDCHVCSK